MSLINDIRRERKRQDEKWGAQRHYTVLWFIILLEEIGEIAKALLELRVEIIQALAVILAWGEDYASRNRFDKGEKS